MCQVGAKVKCVNAANSGGFLVAGATYTVERESPDYYYLLKSVDGPWIKGRFAPIPTARSTDPATSKGKRRINKYEQAVLDVLGCEPHGPQNVGLTGKEMAVYTGHPLNCITPRFAPLRRKGLIKPKTDTIDGVVSVVKRDKQIVWVRV